MWKRDEAVKPATVGQPAGPGAGADANAAPHRHVAAEPARPVQCRHEPRADWRNRP